MWHAQQGFTRWVRDHGSVLIQDRGRRLWLLPRQLQYISTNGKEEQSTFNFAPLLYFSSSRPLSSSLCFHVYETIYEMTPSSICHSPTSHSLILFTVFYALSHLDSHTFPPFICTAVFHLICNFVMTQWDIEIRSSLYSTVAYICLNHIGGALSFASFRGQTAEPLGGLCSSQRRGRSPSPNFLPDRWIATPPFCTYIYTLVYFHSLLSLFQFLMAGGAHPHPRCVFFGKLE